ncbi:MAG TPA: cupin domain-containing protein [Candidatus Eisenbacteria bacterium]|nr:cupin domain-containing protein [Candidatus Eisenbacteria bacterium]
MSADADAWVRRLALAPHPEGGCYRETWRSAETLAAGTLPPRFEGARPLGTTIYYLLRAGERSRLHRLRADELWALHAGGPLSLHLLADGGHREVVLGGDAPHHVAPHGAWIAAEPAPGAPFALVTCATWPGFAFADFEPGARAALLADFPGHGDVVRRFTDPGGA